MRRGILLAVVAAALAAPAAAWPHAALLATVPQPSNVLNRAPHVVSLRYSEAVEPRFAIVSVTDANGKQESSGPPTRAAADPRQLDVPLHALGQGWYLVFWRVISADGHPVRGAFVFAVGPNPGPQPQFVIPSLSESATSTRLVISRWLAFLTTMAAIGLFVLRAFVARPLRAPPRALATAFAVALTAALVLVPVYVLLATSQFALRSMFAIGALVPIMRASAFGRGYLELELLLALFGVAAAIVLYVDRPGRKQRSVAELLALTGALLAAGAVLLAPSAAGHASQTSPRTLAVALDWLHLASGSLWAGGLLGLLVLWRSLPALERVAGLAVCVPRFSNVALGSVALLLGSGIWASVLHLPTLGSLWHTSYGQTILVKSGLLLAAMALGALNFRRTTPALRRAKGAAEAAALLRRLVGGEVVLVSGAIAAAAVLSSLAPPAKALASIGKPAAKVGPGPADEAVTRNGYRVVLRVTPNRAAAANTIAVRLDRDGSPVRGADVSARFTMLDMEMGSQEYTLPEGAPGRYGRTTPALVMVGHWGLTFRIAPRGAEPFDVVLLDRAGG